MFGAYETQYGLPSGFLSRTAQIESAFNPMARNPNSSAGGLFQFIDSTAQQYGLEDRFDPAQATDAAARLARDNAAMLRRTLGREPTAAELYLAHQQGGGGASKLLANPNARAVDVVGVDAVRLNGGDENMTAGQFASKWLDKFDMIEGGAGSDRLAGGLSILPNRPDRLEDNAMQPEKSGGLLGGLWDKTGLDEEKRAMLAMALSGMSMRPNQGLQAAAQMKMKNASDRKTRNKTIDWLQSRGRDDLARAVASGALDGRSAAQLAMAPAQDERTSLEKNVQLIMDNNPGMSFNDALDRANRGLSVTLPGGPVVGDAPKDMTYARNPDGSVMMEPFDLGDGRMGQRPVVIPMQGTKAAQDFTAQETQEINAIESANRMLDTIDSTLNDPALGWATGASSWTANIPGTGAYRAGTKINQLQGQTFLTAYESLKGSGQITEVEGRQATQAIARLQSGQRDEDFVEALKELRTIVLRAKARAEKRAGSRASDLTDDDLLDIYGN